KASFSNFGAHVDVCAPGVRLISTFPGRQQGEYARWSGTSFAAPLAAAEAALVVAFDPRQPDVKRVVEDTASANVYESNPGLAGRLGKGGMAPLAGLQSLNATDGARPFSDVHSKIDLPRGPAGENAFGKASIAVKGAREEFALEA